MNRRCQVEDCTRAHFASDWCQMHYARVRKHGDPHFTLRRVIAGDTKARFWPRIEKTAGCWLWTGRLYRNGYGNHWDSENKRGILAHRYSYELANGPIPKGMQLDHTCHDRSCVNPAHLRLVTNKQNNENPAGLRCDNTTGYRGVELIKSTGRYRAVVMHHQKKYAKQSFATPEEAAEAARQMRLSLFTHNDADRRAA